MVNVVESSPELSEVEALLLRLRRRAVEAMRSSLENESAARTADFEGYFETLIERSLREPGWRWSAVEEELAFDAEARRVLRDCALATVRALEERVRLRAALRQGRRAA